MSEQEKSHSKIKSFFKEYRFLITMISSLIVFLSVSIYILFYPNSQTIQWGIDSKPYLESFTFALPSVVAIIIIMNIFYLGKFHDYNREYIKQIWNYMETRNKIETKMDSHQIVIDQALLDEMKEDIEYFGEQEAEFGSESKWLIFYTLMISGLLIFVTMFFLSGDYSNNDLFFILVAMSFVIVMFVLFLVANEQTITRHNVELKIILNDNVLLRGYLESHLN